MTNYDAPKVDRNDDEFPKYLTPPSYYVFSSPEFKRRCLEMALNPLKFKAPAFFKPEMLQPSYFNSRQPIAIGLRRSPLFMEHITNEVARINTMIFKSHHLLVEACGFGKAFDGVPGAAIRHYEEALFLSGKDYYNKIFAGVDPADPKGTVHISQLISNNVVMAINHRRKDFWEKVRVWFKRSKYYRTNVSKMRHFRMYKSSRNHNRHFRKPVIRLIIGDAPVCPYPELFNEQVEETNLIAPLYDGSGNEGDAWDNYEDLLNREEYAADWMKDIKRTKDRIKCPECGLEQDAEILHTLPWKTYVHDCIFCGYEILESEWESVKPT